MEEIEYAVGEDQSPAKRAPPCDGLIAREDLGGGLPQGSNSR
jgi:hypothetical protein